MRKVIAMLLAVTLLFGMLPAGTATEVEDQIPSVSETVPETLETTAEEPAAEEPAAEEPAAEEPAAEEPVVEPAEEPAEEPTEEPAEEPAEEETSEEEPVVEGSESTGGEAETLTPPGGVQKPSEKYYDDTHKFGFDSMTSGGTVVGATVSVGSAALTEGNASSTNAAALANGVTVTFQPGYYLHSYKIVCGDKYSCNTAAQGMAVHVTSVMTGATQASYKVTLTKTALGHSSEKGPYWILLDIRQDEVKYKVTYNWGILDGQLTDAVPATETHLVNEVVTVKDGSADAIAQAKTLGYRFLGWSNSVDGTVYQPGEKFGMPAKDVVLTALWEAIPEDTLNPGTGSLLIPFTKTWDDNSNEHNLRPETLVVRLYKYVEGGEKILVEEKTLTADSWSCTFDISGENLADEEGNLYKFTVEEVVPANYTEVAAEHQDPNVIFNPAVNGGWNRITPCSELSITTSGDYKSVVIVKKGNQYIVWTVEALTQSEREMLFESAVLNISGMGGAQFANTVFISGIEGHYGGMTVNPEKITFSASENWSFFATGFYQKSSASANSSAITNKLNPQTVSVSGAKTWNDAGNQDGIRPASITVRLYADGVEVASKTVTAADGWAWSFADLPKYTAGKEIVYTVSEDPITGYSAVVSGYNVTNTHVPETINISGTKTWDDNDDQDGIRPDFITINLLANGEQIESVTVTAAEGWKWSFNDLPKYAAGQEIVYTITEEKVDGYDTIIKDFDVTNSHAPSQITVEGTKTWNDANDQDGIRPGSVTVRLFADGVEVASKTVTAAEGWKWSFAELPEFNAGVKIVYTVTEDPVDGYTAVVTGYNVTNTHTPETTDISGAKTWDDSDNQDGIRPASITVSLLANGEVVDTVTVTAEDNWAWSFTDLPVYAEGQKITYTLSEAAVDGYETVVNGFDITNIHVPETTVISGAKTWDDSNDQDGIRPASITVNLLANGEVVKTVTVTEEDGWAWSFTDLPVYADGQKITYTVSEEAVEGYEATVDGFNITNIHVPSTVEVAGVKTWDDNGDQDGKRPDSITVHLLADGVEVATATVTAEDNWAWSFTDLPEFKDGVKIVYTVREDAVDGYTATVDGYNINNTHIPEKINISGTKTWDDNDDQDGIRPEFITINLLANGEVVQTVTVTEEDGWAWSFNDLPKYAGGQEIVYTLTEEAVDGYETVIKDFDVTNSHTPYTVDIEGAKTWDDADDQDGKRPESITVHLFADGVEVASVTVTAKDNWAWSFTGMPEYKAGVRVVYTVTEDPVEGYETSVDGYNVTNTHVPETTDIEGAKTWDDYNNQDGKRPASITVHLLADGKEVASKTVTAEDGWVWNFTDLPVYAAGEKITYTVTEDPVEGYTAKVEGFNITNTHTPETVDLEGAKTWDDNNNQDGKRPETITVRLFADGVEVIAVEVSEETGWSWSFKGMPKYADGKEIVYTVAEDSVEGYEAAVEGFDITNTHVPETVTVSGGKTWQDNNDQDGIRPDSITVNLLADGQKVASKTVTAEDGWKWSFENLPKYADGVRIVYTVEEMEVEGYTSTVIGYNVINVHIPEVITISGTKTWDDGNDQDGIRPDSITVNLLANGVKVDSVEVKPNILGSWKFSFKNLPKYENGKEIVYTVEEEAVEGYTTKVEGFNITNSHETEITELNVKKVWDDKNDQNKKRPTSVKITLYANGKSTGKTLVLSAANSWAGTFKDLPMNEGGKAIKYTVKEETVNSYKATYTYSGNSATVTNTFSVIPVTGDISGLTGHMLLMSISAAALVVLVIFGKRRFLF